MGKGPWTIAPRKAVQRFVRMEALDEAACTIEEREEYEPHLAQGGTVYAAVDLFEHPGGMLFCCAVRCGPPGFSRPEGGFPRPARFVDPRPYAVGSISRTFSRCPHLGPVLPAMGYGTPTLAGILQGLMKQAKQS